MKTKNRLPVFIIFIILASANIANAIDFDQFFSDLKTDSLNYVENAGGTALQSTYGWLTPGTCGDSWAAPIGSQVDSTVDKSSLTVFGASWLRYIIIISFIVLFVAILIYMSGNFLQSQNLISNAKDMFFELGRTIVALFFILMMMQAGQTWYLIKTGHSDDLVLGQATMIDGSMAFSRLMITEISSTYSFLLIYNTVIHTLFSATMWFGITWRAMFSFNLGPVMKPLIDIVGFAMQFLSVALQEWIVHLIMLCMIKKWTWVFFIPLAMIMRSIPPLRGAGDALLALFASFAVMYPFMFLVTYESHRILQNTLAIDITSQSDIMSNFISNNGLLGVGLTVLAIVILSAAVFVPLFMGAGLTIAFELIRSAIYYIVIMSLLMPFLNIFVTLTFAREFATFLNVDVNFMSFSRWV